MSPFSIFSKLLPENGDGFGNSDIIEKRNVFMRGPTRRRQR